MQNVFLIVWLVLFFIALVMLLRHLLLWRRAGTTKEEPTPPQAEPVKTAEQSPPAENKTKEDTTTQERPESSKDNFAPAPEEHTLPNSEPKISEQQILNEKLLWAVILGNLELTRQLHEQGGDVNTVDELGFSATNHALRHPDSALLAYLLQHATLPAAGKNSLDNLLYHAVEQNSANIHLLLNRGANTKPEDEEPMLIRAISLGNTVAVRALLERGEDPDIRSRNGMPAPIVAARANSVEIFQLLMEHDCGYDVDDADGHNALHHAALCSHTEMIAFLVKDDLFHLETPDKQERSPLLLAAQFGSSLETVSQLAQAGADIQAWDKNGDNILHIAAYMNRPELAAWAVEAGVDLTHKNQKNLTPYQVAVQQNHRHIARLYKTGDIDLAKARAEIDKAYRPPLRRRLWKYIKEEWLMPPLENIGLKLFSSQVVESAQQGDSVKLSEALNVGAPADNRDKLWGATALMWALLHRHVTCARLLLEKGADPDALSTKGGWIARQWAEASGDKQLLQLMDEFAATQKISN